MHRPKIRAPGFSDLELITDVETYFHPRRDLSHGDGMRFRDWLQFHVGLHLDVVDWLYEAPCQTTRATAERLVDQWREDQCD